MSSPARPRMAGVGRVLVIVYAVMALGATGRSFVQIAEKFDQAPLAYTLSAVSALVYIVATLALIFAGSAAWYRVAWLAISFELVGVLVIGTLSIVLPGLFQHPTVWSLYGIGYFFIPLVLPFFGIWWLVTHRPVRVREDDALAVTPMMVFTQPADVPAGFGPSVVAIGKFDGVHAGHRAVIERAKVDAASSAARVVAVTFDRNPLSVLRPEICPESLLGVTQKVQLLGETGIDAALVLRFDRDLANLTPREFVEHVLVDALGARTVLVGADFRFGRGGAGTPDTLRELGEELGFTVHVVDDVRAIDDDRRVSSTWIRQLLADGDVETAAKLLGRPPSVWGEVVHGAQRGRLLGYPTANLAPDREGFVPADGVYAGWLIDEGSALRGGIRYPAAISVGTNPTFDDVPQRQVEAYVLDETGLDLYGHLVEVQFVSRIRGMVAFDGVEPLIEQMADDVARVRSVLTE